MNSKSLETRMHLTKGCGINDESIESQKREAVFCRHLISEMFIQANPSV